jgi:hypothetical protein
LINYSIVSSSFGNFSPNEFQDIPSPQKISTSSQLPKIDYRNKSPMIKRTTNLRGMGKFWKITNKKLIINAISNCLLNGELWRVELEEIVQLLDLCEDAHFIILLKSIQGKMKFYGVYQRDNNEGMTKIHSIYKTPDTITSKMVNEYFRFDPVNQEFQEIVGMKSFHDSTDAVTLKTNYERYFSPTPSEQLELFLLAKRHESATKDSQK